MMHRIEIVKHNETGSFTLPYFYLCRNDGPVTAKETVNQMLKSLGCTEAVTINVTPMSTTLLEREASRARLERIKTERLGPMAIAAATLLMESFDSMKDLDQWWHQHKGFDLVAYEESSEWADICDQLCAPDAGELHKWLCERTKEVVLSALGY